MSVENNIAGYVLEGLQEKPGFLTWWSSLSEDEQCDIQSDVCETVRDQLPVSNWHVFEYLNKETHPTESGDYWVYLSWPEPQGMVSDIFKLGWIQDADEFFRSWGGVSHWMPIEKPVAPNKSVN